MIVYVYKITRLDGLEYVGTTINPNKRLKEHLRTNRFKSGVSKFEIIDQTDDYQEALKLEESYITKFDTYHNGLNLTPNGGKLKDDGKFNTFGMKFEDVSKEKMRTNHWSKTGSYDQSGRKLSDETKNKIRSKQLGKCHNVNQRRLTNDNIEYILKVYANDMVQFTPDYIRKFVTISQKPIVEALSFNELKAQNGKPITREKLYSEYFAELFKVNPNTIRAVINGKNTRSIKV